MEYFLLSDSGRTNLESWIANKIPLDKLVFGSKDFDRAALISEEDLKKLYDYFEFVANNTPINNSRWAEVNHLRNIVVSANVGLNKEKGI